MRRYTPAARIWIVTVTAVTIVVSVLMARYQPVAPRDWLTLGILGVCAAVAHFFPIRSTSNEASFRLTNVFIIAGAIILPVNLLTLLAIIALAPESWRDRRRTSGIVRWVFNTAQAALAANVSGFLVHAFSMRHLADLSDLMVIVGGAICFIIVQNLIVGVAMSLHFRTALWNADVLQWTALVTDGMYGLLGLIVVGMWFASPMLLFLLVPAFLLAHNLTRTAHLAALAQYDPKTGLPNARYFERALEQALTRTKRTRAPLSLLFADLDHFKRVNDQYGHAVGDFVLREVARLVRTTLRRGDTFARFGGEEFVALLPNTDIENARAVAEKVCTAIAEHAFVLDDGKIVHCTISIGVATAPQDGTEAKALVTRADWAMYQAKQARNTTLHEIAPRRFATSAGERDTYPIDGVLPAPSAPSAARRPIAWRTRLAPLVLWGTALGGSAAIAWGAVMTTRTGGWSIIPLFILLAAAAELFPIQMYKADREKMTISYTYAAIMAVMVIQPFAAPLVNAAAALVHVLWHRQRRFDKVAFNLTNPALAAACASGVFLVLDPGVHGFTTARLIASLASVLVFSVVNIGIVSVMISLHSTRSLARVIHDSLWFGPVTILLGLTGAFLAAVHTELGVIGAVMFAVPVIMMGFTLAFGAHRSQQAIEALETSKVEAESAAHEKTQTLRQVIETVASIIDARDNLVLGHSRNVAEYSALIGEELRLTPGQLALVRTAGLLHDLGKVAIPEAILHKPGTLTADEYALVKQHPATGKRILAEVDLLSEVAQMVGDHHERFDGMGYPQGIAGNAISIGGRILAVADTLDSILSDRVYARARPLAEALAELDRYAGSQFDPAVVAALHRVVATHGTDLFSKATEHLVGVSPGGEPSHIIAFPTERAATHAHVETGA